MKTRRKRKERRWKLVLVKEDKERKRTEREPAPRARKREKHRNHIQSLPLKCAVLMNRGEGVTQITAHRTIILREQIGWRVYNGWPKWEALPFSNNSLDDSSFFRINPIPPQLIHQYLCLRKKVYAYINSVLFFID